MARKGIEYYLVKAVLKEGVWQRTPSEVKHKQDAEAAIRVWAKSHQEQGWDVDKVGDAYLAVKGDEQRSIALHEYTAHEWPSLRARLRTFHTVSGDWRFREILGHQLVVDKAPTAREPVEKPTPAPRRGRKPAYA